jgi:hypothetical protein
MREPISLVIEKVIEKVVLFDYPFPAEYLNITVDKMNESLRFGYKGSTISLITFSTLSITFSNLFLCKVEDAQRGDDTSAPEGEHGQFIFFQP